MSETTRIPGFTNTLLGRVAVRTDGKLVMGAVVPGIPGTLEAGALYEIRDDGENIILKKIGMSSLTDIQNGHPLLSHQGRGTWGCDIGTIVRSHGHYLMTSDELLERERERESHLY